MQTILKPSKQQMYLSPIVKRRVIKKDPSNNDLTEEDMKNNKVQEMIQEEIKKVKSISNGGDDTNDIDNSSSENKSKRRSSDEDNKKCNIYRHHLKNKSEFKINQLSINDVIYSEKKTNKKKALPTELLPKSQTVKVNPKLVKSVQAMSKAGKGEDGFVKVNQDSFIRIENIFHKNNFNLFGVLDGHGMNGNLVSQFVGKYFTMHINSNKKLKILPNEEEIYKAMSKKNYEPIRYWFSHSEKDITKNDIDANFSGTTCVMLFHIGKKLICANVGDSRCIVITDDDIIPLSRDHKPNDPLETERIISHGGYVSQYEEDGVLSGPYRVWKKGEMYPGISMSRSIGDLVATTLGVVPEPEIMEKEIDNDTKAIIIASDGIWNRIDNKKAKDIIMPYYDKKDSDTACSELIKEASILWESEEVSIDDITAIVIFF